MGGALVFFPDLIKRVQPTVFLGISLALSAGVMLYVSFIEIFAKALDEISSNCNFSDGGAIALTTVMFFLGMLVCVLVELLVHRLTAKDGHDHHIGCPAHTQPTDVAKWSSSACDEPTKVQDSSTVADVSVADVSISMPEQAGQLDEQEKLRLTRMGMMTAIAIALHNFPEGTTAAPVRRILPAHVLL